MIGAIAGDIIGSFHEGLGTKTKVFPLFGANNWFTDDTVLTIAVAESILRKADLVDALHDYFHRYPQRGYGGSFIEWAGLRHREPYNSWGNGAAMRVSPVGFAYDTLDDVMQHAERTAAVTHNHPEGIRGAQATAVAVYLARTGSDKQAIRQHIVDVFGYDLSTPLDEIRETYEFDVSCQGSVPQSIIAFLEGTDFEDTVRNAISLGGDADTMACIAGGIAEAYWGVPEAIERRALSFLDEQLLMVVDEFNRRYRSTNRGGTIGCQGGGSKP
jgi:ADP-ribosylglycohydrolase